MTTWNDNEQSQEIDEILVCNGHEKYLVISLKQIQMN